MLNTTTFVGLDVHARSIKAVALDAMTGEVRSVLALQQRLAEAARIGFKTCLIPRHGTGNVQIPDGLEVVRVRNIREAIEFALPV